MNARRKGLEVTHTRSTHTGLWLDRYLKQQTPRNNEGDSDARSKQFDALFAPVVTGAIQSGQLYQSAFERWETLVAAHDGLESRLATVTGRMVVGLGSASVWENSIRLHHTYGVPVIPGSALKGLAARFAANWLGEEWKREGEAHQTMFGTTESAGYVTFYDAWYVSNGDKLPLLKDVITVHHKEYYQEKKDEDGKIKPPADWDSPTPIQFLSANGKYLITLGGVDAWRKRAFEIVALALEHEGIGAKTSSGYGRMKLQGNS